MSWELYSPSPSVVVVVVLVGGGGLMLFYLKWGGSGVQGGVYAT